MRNYIQAIIYISEADFFLKKTPEESDVVALIAFLYGKDELRVIHDVKEYLKNRDKPQIGDAT